MEPYEDGGFSWLLYPYAGILKNPNDKLRASTGLGFYAGKVPGIMFGISSQQYYNMMTEPGTLENDIRLSGEIILALFGFLGYRYQYPLSKENEALHISRHALVFKIPIPLKKIK
ncbi:MAG: hypothetical protein V2I46_13550 [Bacteroides sp.]|nr:hypothetical protein [Bacteroides sp.]